MVPATFSLGARFLFALRVSATPPFNVVQDWQAAK
jgi:hypothetical protein